MFSLMITYLKKSKHVALLNTWKLSCVDYFLHNYQLCMRVNKGNFSFHETSFPTCTNIFLIFSYIRCVLRNIFTQRSIEGYIISFIPVVLQPKLGPGCLFFLVISRSHTIRNTHALPWMSDQLVAEAATYTTQSSHKRRASITSVGFELVIPEIKRCRPTC
jgi:hypothetical protein